MKAFEYDSGFMKFAILLSRLTLLNLIWLIACIPVVTIGASTAAMHYSAAKLMNDDSHVFGNYKTGFRTYWKKGTVIWLITAVFSAIFGMASYLFQTARIPYHTVLMVISGMAFLTLLLVVIWIYPTVTGVIFQCIYLRFYVRTCHTDRSGILRNRRIFIYPLPAHQNARSTVRTGSYRLQYAGAF